MNTATSPIRVGLPPGPKGTLIGGNIRQFRDRLLDFLLQVARDYGPLTSFRVGPRRIFLASASDLIEQVLITDARHYTKHFGARAFKPVLGNGLVTSDGGILASAAQAHSTGISQDSRTVLRPNHGRPYRADARILDPWEDNSHQ